MTDTLEPRSPPGLLAWQWSVYSTAHRDRRNLLLHALTVPVFILGTVTVVASLALGAWLAVFGGAAAMAFAMFAQGRGHAREAVPPAAFRGPLDVVARVFAEQWITFPRYVMGGGFGEAWKRAKERPVAQVARRTDRRG